MCKTNEKWQLVSMTGSAKSSFSFDYFKINIFIKSVNHRNLDIKITSNKSLKEYENKLRDIINYHIKRGYIDCCIEVLDINDSSFSFNESKILSLVKQYEKLSKKHSFFKPSISFSDIISLSNLNELDTFNEEQVIEIINKLPLLVEDLYKSRLTEGTILSGTIGDFIYKIFNNITEIKKANYDNLSEKVLYLQRKMLEIIKNESNIFDEQRIYQEAALLAQKSDFTEEIDRLFAHIQHFDEVCREQQLKGKKLDFICQEMLREVNTLLSKASRSEIIKIAIDTKSYVENLREQIQNIE